MAGARTLPYHFATTLRIVLIVVTEMNKKYCIWITQHLIVMMDTRCHSIASFAELSPLSAESPTRIYTFEAPDDRTATTEERFRPATVCHYRLASHPGRVGLSCVLLLQTFSFFEYLSGQFSIALRLSGPVNFGSLICLISENI